MARTRFKPHFHGESRRLRGEKLEAREGIAVATSPSAESFAARKIRLAAENGGSK